MRSLLRNTRYAVVALAALLCTSSLAGAEDFRIATKIYRGKDDKAKLVSETTTLFLNGTVYDFLADGSQIAVFRKEAREPGRFILLNPPQRIQTELSTEKLTGLMEHLRDWAGRQNDPMLKFAANPQFKESYDDDSGQLVLASNLETYTVETDPASHPEAVAEYREFLHWYTQLNTMLSAGPPPEPRLQLNEALSRHRVVPRRVELSLSGEKEPLRAEHEFNWRLSQEDMAQIDDVRTSLTRFRELSNEDFEKTTRAAQPAK